MKVINIDANKSEQLLKLGDFYISDFLEKNQILDSSVEKYSLDLILDENTKSVRLKELAPRNKMYGKYWYKSGTNEGMVRDLSSLVTDVLYKLPYIDYKNKIWLDIACNDGTLLSKVPNDFIKLGIDPADDQFFKESSKVANAVVQDYFNLDAYRRTGYGDKKCDIITIIAMFYDIEDTDNFVKDLYEILDDNGLLVLQLSYTPLMIMQNAYDNICHEHVYYHSLTSLETIFNKGGFKLVDVDINAVNCGSVRVYIQKNIADENSYANSHVRDIAKFKLQSFLENEYYNLDITNETIWKDFKKRIDIQTQKLVDFLTECKTNNKKVFGYGASTKGNTILQYANITSDLLECIVERQPQKFGLKTVGTNIPIISEEDMRNNPPDYLLILPWTFINEFVRREQDFLKNGGKFIVPLPEFKIIGI